MNYKTARDAAWAMLAKNHITELPIDVRKICKSERVRVLTYEQGKEVIQSLGLEEHTRENDAFSFARVIFYNDSTTPERQRFSIAHELGHIVLHASDGATVYNREVSPNDNPIESEANVFASRLLAPLCVLHFLGVSSPQEISALCAISAPASEIRYRRLCEIRARDEQMRKKNGRGCFLLSPLERKIYRNFKRYIRKTKNNAQKMCIIFQKPLDKCAKNVYNSSERRRQ